MCRTKLGFVLLFLLACSSSESEPEDADSSTSALPSSDGAASSSTTMESGPSVTSDAGSATTSISPSSTSGVSSSSEGDAGSSSGGLDPFEICRMAKPDPGCPIEIGLPGTHRCRDLDVYIYETPDECQPPVETRCEVLQSDVTGGLSYCASEGITPDVSRYNEGWFREVDDGRLEFWGVRWVGNNPPAAPGFTRCFDAPQMCACECDLIQPE